MKIFMMISFITGLNCDTTTDKTNQTETKDSVKSQSELETSDTSSFSNPQQKILNGAKSVLNEKSKYDLTMGYYVLNYFEGEKGDEEVYPGGDLDPTIGVCTDVVIRSLRRAGTVDLQKAIHEDLIKDKSSYPLGIWGSTRIDRNIDHRRVTNLKVWFTKYWQIVHTDNVQPGDVVIWDMNKDGKSEHTGIVSDRKSNGTYLVIHSHQDPGYVAEENKLHKWKITGLFRVK